MDVQGSGRWARRSAVRLLLVTLVVGATVAATAVTTASGRGAATVTLTLSYVGDYTPFDLQADEAGLNTQIYAAYDRVLAYDKNGKIVPYIGSVVSQTPSSITVKIRSGVKCPDGSTVDAKLVQQSLQRLIRVPKRSGFIAFYFGPGPYSVSAAPKANTVTFRTGTPYRHLAYGLGAPASIVICPAGFTALGSDDHALENKDYGSGPYSLVSAQHGVQIVLQKRANWNWGPFGRTAKDMADQVVYKPVTNTDTAVNLALTGDLDAIAVTTVGSSLDRMKASSDFWLQEVKDWGPGQNIVYNERPDHLTADKTLREALAMPISPADFQQAYQGLGHTQDSLLNPGMDCYDKSVAKSIPHGTVADARALLTKNGYTYKGSQLTTPDGRSVRLRVLSLTPNMNQVPDYLASVYGQLGVDVDTANLAQPFYGQNILAGNFDVGVSAGSQTIPAPGFRLAAMWGPTSQQGGTNLAASGPPAMNRQFRLALATLGKTSCQHFTNAIRMGFENVNWTQTFVQQTDVFYRKSKIADMWPEYRVLSLTTLKVKR
jgi:peptide/nickel transport system substrate-binding protein